MIDLSGKNILGIREFQKQDFLDVFGLAREMEDKKHLGSLDGLIVATLFFEASTRTRLSFESAALRLGAKVIGTTDAKYSSLSKGETLFDTGKMVSGYADIIVMRHPAKGAVSELARGSDIPVINAGDGIGEHPTQTFLDLYSIQKSKGTIDGLKIGFVGDLKYGRTIHSLAVALRHFDVEMYFVSPPALSMPKSYKEELWDVGVEIFETESIEEYLSQMDVMYIPRIQEERFDNREEYMRYRNQYIVDLKLLHKAKSDIQILSPLPRVVELPTEIDDTPNAQFFDQARNAVPVRQALLALVAGRV